MESSSFLPAEAHVDFALGPERVQGGKAPAWSRLALESLSKSGTRTPLSLLGSLAVMCRLRSQALLPAGPQGADLFIRGYPLALCPLRSDSLTGQSAMFQEAILPPPQGGEGLPGRPQMLAGQNPVVTKLSLKVTSRLVPCDN